MRLANIGWMFVGLALVLLSAFVLSRGVLVRADVELPIFGGPPWPKHCKYFGLKGTFRETSVVANDQGNPAATFCPFLRRTARPSRVLQVPLSLQI
jgi:hypothetical protein